MRARLLGESVSNPTPAAPARARAVSEPAPAPDPAPEDPPVAPPAAGPDHRVRNLLVSGGLYLALSVGVWWHVWSSHPTSVTTCGCGDSSLFTWFLEWPAYAISHGLNPLYSTAMFHPGGVNLLSNTSEVGIGVVLAPVTWLFGPVATLNVALTLAPVLSALAMFVLLRRWVSWAPAAFAGGLLYGFSPLVVVSLTDAHLMIGMLFVPPLVVACLDELLVRQRRRPVRVGVVLGLLLVVQFFIGTETLVIMVVTGSVGLVLVVAYAGLRHRETLRSHARHALVGLGTGAAITAVLLAYPVWFALDGPAHLSGLIWPTLVPGLYGIRPATLYRLNDPSSAIVDARRLGGYQGTGIHQAEFLGAGLIVVLVVGLLLWRRDRRLWLFGAVGVAAIVLSLSVADFNGWVPWRWLRSVPVLQNVLPDRFMEMTVLCAAVMFGLIVDRCHRWVGLRVAGGGGPGILSRDRGRIVAGGTAGLLVLLALVPMAGAYDASLPFTVEPVVLPDWFTSIAPHLPPGQVVLTYPSSYGGFQSLLTWQAVDRMAYAEMEGGGPGQAGQRAGSEQVANSDLAHTSLLLDPAIAYTPATVVSVRQAILHAGVTRVVVPDQTELPQYEQGFHPSYAVGLMTVALGSAPRWEARAWVWTPEASVPSLTIDPGAFETCVTPAPGVPNPPHVVAECLLAGR